MTEPHIEILNIKEGQSLNYALVLLEGQFHCDWDLPENVFAEIHIGEAATSWPVTHSGRFKALVHLPTIGHHEIVLNIAETYQIFPVEYKPRETNHCVRFYYQISKDSDGCFDAPNGVDNSIETATEKVKFNALMLQTAMAELFHAHRFPRDPFQYEMDEHGQPIVHLLHSSFTDETARSVGDQKLFKMIHLDVKKQGFFGDGSLHYKHAVIMGCSKYNKQKRKVEGHTALGGEAVGIFGSSGIHAWASKVEQVTKCFLDNTLIDEAHLFDDSCFRKTYWANYSTGLGAFLHEMCHTFGILHSVRGIMARGFDDLNHLFCIYAPKKPYKQATYTNVCPDGKLFLKYHTIEVVQNVKGAHFHRASALKLRKCKWVNDDIARQNLTESNQPPTVTWGHKVGGLVGNGKNDGTQRVFGADFQHRADIAGFLIESDETVNHIEILSHESLNDLLLANLSISGNQDLFLLMDGEVILHMDVYASDYIHAIRFLTNVRMSRYFGKQNGTLTSLTPLQSHYFYSIFGTKGDKHIGSIGALMRLIPNTIQLNTPTAGNSTALSNSNSSATASGGATFAEQAESMFKGTFDSIFSSFSPNDSNSASSSNTSGKFAAVGLGIDDGDQVPFDYHPNPYNSNNRMSCIIIECTNVIHSVRVLNTTEYRQQFQDGYFCSTNEHVFCLMDAEGLIQVDVMCNECIYAIRFHTNKRISPWFGGELQGSIQSFHAPPNAIISAFYGTRANTRIGTFGCYFDKFQFAPSPSKQSIIASNSLNTSGKEQLVNHELHCILGFVIVLDTKNHTIVHIESFRTVDSYNDVVSQSQHESNEVVCVLLGKGEYVTQLDVYYDDNTKNLNSICFHSNVRCSPWYGSTLLEGSFLYHQSNAMAFDSIVYKDCILNYTYNSIANCCVHSPLSKAKMESSAGTNAITFEELSREHIFFQADQANESTLLESLILTQYNNGNTLVDTVFEWPMPSRFPRVWYFTYDVLSKSMDHSKFTLNDYCLEVIDTNGMMALSRGSAFYNTSIK